MGKHAGPDSGEIGKYAGKRLYTLTKQNPHRKGSHEFRSFALIEDGMTYETFISRGGGLQDLDWDVRKGYVDARPEADDRKVVHQLLAPKAWELLQSRPETALVDVRSTAEYTHVGHPVGSLLVPLMEPPAWQPLPDFAARVRAVLGKHPGTHPLESIPLLLICRSGSRSQVAAELLLQDGFTEVYNISDGFEGGLDGRNHRSTINGWRCHNLPWEQS